MLTFSVSLSLSLYLSIYRAISSLPIASSLQRCISLRCPCFYFALSIHYPYLPSPCPSFSCVAPFSSSSTVLCSVHSRGSHLSLELSLTSYTSSHLSYRFVHCWRYGLQGSLVWWSVACMYEKAWNEIVCVCVSVCV
jgi:hypothetical protein